jgi:VWFA-related protein
VPTFRSGVTLARVSVVVKDKQGKPVADLRREDFQIFDNGLPQQIRLFLSESDILSPSPPKPRAPNTFANQIASTAGSHSGYSVILIDSLFTDWGDIAHPGAANSRVSALRALQSMPAGEKIAIYATTRKLQVICEFTSDRDLLTRQLDRWKASVDTIEASKAIFAPASTAHPSIKAHDFDGVTHLPPPGAGSEEDPAVAAAHIDALQRASSSNDLMDLVADHLAGIPGRKNLIWLSNRFVIGTPELRKFNAAGVAIYPVNIDGVTGNLDPLNQVLKSIAAQTGGMAYDMRNDIDVAIGEAVDDGRIGYTLGFYQSGDDISNPFDQRRPGITLRYYPTQAPLPASARTIADLIQALKQPVDATAIPIKATATRVQDSLNLQAVVDVDSLELAASQGRWNGKVEIVAASRRRTEAR